jgi:hypothetical protein
MTPDEQQDETQQPGQADNADGSQDQSQGQADDSQQPEQSQGDSDQDSQLETPQPDQPAQPEVERQADEPPTQRASVPQTNEEQSQAAVDKEQELEQQRREHNQRTGGGEIKENEVQNARQEHCDRTGGGEVPGADSHQLGLLPPPAAGNWFGSRIRHRGRNQSVGRFSQRGDTASDRQRSEDQCVPSGACCVRSAAAAARLEGDARSASRV